MFINRGQPSARADEHGLKALFQQLVHREHPADDHVGLHLDAQCLQAVDLFLDDGLGQAELGDAVDQHAPGGVQRLKHGDLIALLGQIPGAGEPGGAGAHHGHLMAVGGGALGGLTGVGVVPVGYKAL